MQIQKCTPILQINQLIFFIKRESILDGKLPLILPSSKKKFKSSKDSFLNFIFGCENGAITSEKIKSAEYFINLQTFLVDLYFFQYSIIF
ncbi:unnamed protein product [Paramecium pentaurelia]|uniref:Uncharacterized protein n=1 Tax=Paramecium pentaurelia TaxID=43138 RepID=A0A8S1VV81_9CILI|nr:unnamed protein product [Paramecium pentaurelia]